MNEQPAHTAEIAAFVDGPWRTNIARLSDGSINAAHVVTEGGNMIAQIANYDEATTIFLLRLIAASKDLLEAAQLLEAAELSRQDCDDCEGEGEEQACEKCFLLFDDARIKRRLAIAKATGERTPVVTRKE